MRSSYARKLAEQGQFEVANYSIGASPNVSLLYSLTQAADQHFDYVIVEPAVTDAEWLRLGHYDRKMLDTNFREFVKQVRARWQARIILIIIPTRLEILDDEFSPRDYYRALMESMGERYIDLYSVYEQFFAEDSSAQSMFFQDRLHLSPSMFSVLASALQGMMADDVAASRSGHATTPLRQAGSASCTFARPQTMPGAERREVERGNSFVTQRFLLLKDGETVGFQAERDCRLVALVVNRKVASAVVSIECEQASEPLLKDLRLRPDPRGTFTLHVVPLRRQLRGKSFRLQVLAANMQPDAAIEFYELRRSAAQGRRA